MGEVSTVEFGPREFQLASVLRRDLLRGELAFVEKDYTYVEPLKAKLKEGGIKGKVIHEDAQVIDFKSEGIAPAATIFAKDLFGQAGLFGRNRYGAMEEKVDLDFGKVAENWFRNSTADARVVVFEVATPANKKSLVDVFLEKGFKVSEDYRGGDMKKIFDQKRTGEDLVFANSSVEMAPRDAYAIVFEKVRR